MQHKRPEWEWCTILDTDKQALVNLMPYKELKTKSFNICYLLSESDSEYVQISDKITDQTIEIRVILRSNKYGLHQWATIYKARFPIYIQELLLICKCFRIPFQASSDEIITYEDFIQNVIPGQSKLKRYDIYKKESYYSVEDAAVEIANLVINDIWLRTLIIRHQELDSVLNAIHKLNLLGAEQKSLLNEIKTKI